MPASPRELSYVSNDVPRAEPSEKQGIESQSTRASGRNPNIDFESEEKDAVAIGGGRYENRQHLTPRAISYRYIIYQAVAPTRMFRM